MNNLASLKTAFSIKRTLPLLLGFSLALSCLPSPAWAIGKNPFKGASKTATAKDVSKPAEPEQSPQKRTTPARPSPLSAELLKNIEEIGHKLDPNTRNSLNQLAAAVRLEDRAVYNELRDDEETSLSDIGMLWEAAVEHSGTIRYAIEKLSRRDATGQPVGNDTFSKRMVQNLVRLGGVAGSMWTQSPAGLIGSNMVQDMIAGNPQDPALTHVTDADMVIIAKEVEALQTQLLQLYYSYRHAKERLTLAQEARSTITRYFDHAADSPDLQSEALQPLMQSISESARQDENNAQQAVNSARTALGLVVGAEAIAALDQAEHKKTVSTTEQ